MRSADGCEDVGVLLDTEEDRDSLALLLEISWRVSSKRTSLHLFLPATERLQTSPVLLTSTVQWRSASASACFLHFLGKYFYHLKTPHKQVESLELAEIFIK